MNLRTRFIYSISILAIALAMALAHHANAAELTGNDPFLDESLCDLGFIGPRQIFLPQINLEPSAAQKQVIREMEIFARYDVTQVRLRKAASHIRLQRDQFGRVLVDRPVTVIIHGLLNSPAWFQRVENLAWYNGAHVLNIRLPGHFTRRAQDLDDATFDQWMHSIRQAVRWAGVMSDQVTFVGHSTGALGGAIINAEQPGLIKKMILFSPAFQVSTAVHMKVKAFTTLGLSGWIFGTPQNEERYLSTWAGVQVEALSQLAKNFANESDYSAIIAALAQTELIWVDTGFDKTLDVSRNLDLAHQVDLRSRRFQYVLLPNSLQIPHDKNGSFELESTYSLLPLIRNFLAPQ